MTEMQSGERLKNFPHFHITKISAIRLARGKRRSSSQRNMKVWWCCTMLNEEVKFFSTTCSLLVNVYCLTFLCWKARCNLKEKDTDAFTVESWWRVSWEFLQPVHVLLFYCFAGFHGSLVIWEFRKLKKDEQQKSRTQVQRFNLKSHLIIKYSSTRLKLKKKLLFWTFLLQSKYLMTLINGILTNLQLSICILVFRKKTCGAFYLTFNSI